MVERGGRGLSSRELRGGRAREGGRALPADLEWGWDLDSYLLEDLPAAVAAVKERTGRDKGFYVGSSMGGMIGYGYAATHDDPAGLVTIGAPRDIGRGVFLMRAAAPPGPPLPPPPLRAPPLP